MGEQLESVKVSRIGVFSVAVVMAIINAVAGIIFAVVSLLISSVLGTSLLPEGFDFIVGFGALIIYPAALALAGFIGGVFFSLFYNLAAKINGGIELYS